MSDYDIGKAFEEIENELIDSMMRNFSRHRAEEEKEGYNWTQWQAEQLKALEEYRKTNAQKFGKQFKSINSKVEEMIRTARADGNAEQEAKILEAIKNGFTPHTPTGASTGEFFKVNDRKLDALVKSTTDDLKRAETAVLRMSNDKYRKAIFNAQVYANTGAGTYEKAVDMACKDMLNAGLNCVEYKNGARHTLSDYADMAIKTANKRAYLRGEGEERAKYGLSLVVVNSRQGGCSDCAKYIGKVFIDDVYSNGKKSDGDYPLLSTAIAEGLFHPRCKDSTSTYYPELDDLSGPLSDDELAELDRQRGLEVQQQHAEKQAERFDRRAKYSLDEDNKKFAKARADEWHDRALKLGDSNGTETVAKQSKETDIPMTTEKIKDLQERLSKIGIRNVNNIETLETPTVIEPFVNQLEKLSKDYGKMFFRLDVTDLPDGDIAQVTPAKILQLNKRYFNSSAEMNSIIEKFIKDKLLPKCADINYIAAHEWGHFISMDDLKNPKSPLRTLFGRTKPNDFVSENAKVNFYEYVADSIACFVNKIPCKNSEKVLKYYTERG